MFALLKFVGSDELKISRAAALEESNGSFTIKYKCGRYEVEVLLVNDKKVVESFYDNMTKGLPLINITPIKEKESLNLNFNDTAHSRRRWSTPERKLARERFSQYIEKRKVPSVTECRKFLNEYRGTFHDTKPIRLQSWVRHQSKLKYDTNKRNTGRKSWNTPEKSVVKQHFEESLENNKPPSLKECMKVKLKHPLTLLHRSPTIMIKAFLTNEIKRRSY